MRRVRGVFIGEKLRKDCKFFDVGQKNHVIRSKSIQKRSPNRVKLLEKLAAAAGDLVAATTVPAASVTVLFSIFGFCAF